MKKMFLITIIISLIICSCTNHLVPDLTLQDGYVSQVFHDDLNDSLEAIFTSSNSKLKKNCGIFVDSVFIIQNETDLMSICPDNVEVPHIDFSRNCIIYASVVTPSISDELQSSKLYYSKNNNYFLFEICIQCAATGWTAMGQFYPFGVYQTLPIKNSLAELKNIDILRK